MERTYTVIIITVKEKLLREDIKTLDIRDGALILTFFNDKKEIFAAGYWQHVQPKW